MSFLEHMTAIRLFLHMEGRGRLDCSLDRLPVKWHVVRPQMKDEVLQSIR